MVNDRWKTMGGASQLEDRPRDKPQRPSCSYVLCTVLLSLAVLLAVAVTGTVLFLNHAHVPGTAPPPVVSTGPAGANSALVTLLSESQGHMAHLVNSVSDVLDALQRDRGLGRPHVKADLQRAPTRGSRLRGCANGLKRIHALTTQAAYELHVDLEDFDNGTAYAHYRSFGVGLFSVDPEEDGYPLTVADYSGTAGDSLLKHSGMRFTTKDRDSDHSENNCAAFYRGAWWYRNCHTSNLNGQYLRGAHASYADGIEWSSWTGWQYSLKFSEMKIRPVREDR
ncbi:fibrinogen C domain-containing protein 1 [Camelus ferus]|nr:fibrinogen C domain-containing protein 1 [Camelus ferus]